MREAKAKISGRQPINEFCEEVYDFVKNRAKKEDIAFIIKELEEMKAMLEEGKKQHSK